MSLLDLQNLDVELDIDEGDGGGHGGGSQLSLLLCDSVASLTLCL
ncbi:MULTISPECIES: SapB/AmfS family lanthipeptide [unclassified Streptomyces]|nr:MULTISPECIES: SapB/AmfS family lanthipeptide [unclassified Streptomyces]RCH69386.1 SapB/AmfS family lantipeptide [Streptomyces sp. SDr-06]